MTKFSEIYERFLARVEIYSFLNLPVEFREEMLKRYLFDAIALFNDYCEADLFDINEDEQCFNLTLDRKVIYLITECMAVVWLKRERDKEENTKNVIGEKDYTIFSPANLLSSINNAYKDARAELYAEMNDYSLSKFDPMDLVKNGGRF